MPTNTNAYNSRVTDEALEKRFRDTFRSQGGAELVDDLYAQGVIVPVVDFTQAATGDVLEPTLQQAWDFSTGHSRVNNTTTTIVSNAGFWKIDATMGNNATAGANATFRITDGLSSKIVFQQYFDPGTDISLMDQPYVVYLRAGDSFTVQSSGTSLIIDVWYRQIATVNGDLVNPSGFTFS